MSGFLYSISFRIFGGNAIERVAAQADRLDKAVDRVNDSVRKTSGRLRELGSTGQGAFSGLTSGLKGWLASLGIAAFTLSSLQSMAQVDSFNRAITFAGGKEGSENLAFVEREIDRLKLPALAAKEGFQTLSGAMMGTRITAEEQRDIFTSVGEAATVMGLSAQRQQLAFLALGQIASKGNVQMEELRGQLGEQIPGALAISARAMGVSNAKFLEMVEAGLPAEKFLPRFAAELHRTFGGGVQDALNGAQANLNVFNNSVLDLKTSFGTYLLPAVTSVINALIPLFEWVGKNLDVIGFYAVAIGGVYAGMKVYAATTAIATLFTGGFTAGIAALNAAMMANPIGFVIGTLVALSAAVAYAWNKFDWFRGAIVGAWEAIKEFGSIVYDYAIAPLMALGKTIIGTLTFNPTLIAEGLSDGVKAIEKIAQSESIGERMGRSFTAGWNKGVGIESPDPRAAYGDDRSRVFGAPKRPGALADSLADSKSKKGLDGITGGGQRNVTIQIGKLNDGGVTIHTTNLREGAQEVEAIFTRMFLQVVNSANQSQGG